MWHFKSKETLNITQNGIFTRENVALRPTKLCISLLVLSAAIWVGAVNYQVNVAYAVCFWVVGFVGVAALLTRRQLLGLQAECAFQGEVFAGDTAAVQLKWHGGAGQRLRVFWWRGEYAESIDDKQENQFTKWQKTQLSGSLNAQNTVWHIPIERRGVFPQDLFVKVATSAPFGLFHAECRLHWQTHSVAYAAPLSHQNSGNAPSGDPEEKAQNAIANGEDIAYLKPHQQGASLQHIAWKVYAKRGELMDKAFDAPPPAQQNTAISYRDYPQGTPVDKLASLLTYRVLQAEKSGVPYTLELPHLTLTPQNGLREKCLHALALM